MPMCSSIRKIGRPRISDEKLVPAAYNLPVSRVEQITRLARKKGQSDSGFLRNVLDGVLPPTQKTQKEDK